MTPEEEAAALRDIEATIEAFECGEENALFVGSLNNSGLLTIKMLGDTERLLAIAGCGQETLIQRAVDEGLIKTLPEHLRKVLH